MKTEQFTVNNRTYLVKIHIEQRENCRAAIRKNTINIRIPLILSREERNHQIQKMKQWAEKTIVENPEKFKSDQKKQYHTGDILKIGDEKYILNITCKDKKTSSAQLKGNIIFLSVSDRLSREEQNNHISSLISRCIGSNRLPMLQKKIRELNEKHFNQNVTNVFFKQNKSNWGSCSKAGNINISTRLLFAPDDVLEYVCIHELAHLIEPNHSVRFWRIVEKVMPDYKQKEQWLKENKDRCRF